MTRLKFLKEQKCSVETGLAEKRTTLMKNQPKMRIIADFIRDSTNLAQNADTGLQDGRVAGRVGNRVGVK
jgi:hypothetical protein